jgi:hypothetical protein
MTYYDNPYECAHRGYGRNTRSEKQESVTGNICVFERNVELVKP